MYKVICEFVDLQDFDHMYRVGDIFPRTGMIVSDERIAELSSDKNKRHVPLILPVSSDETTVVEDSSTEYKKTDIMRLNKAELVDLAKQNGIVNADDLSGSKLKEMLIEYYNL